MKLKRPCAILFCLILAAAASHPAAAQSGQPFPDDAVRELVRAALLEYFDPASTFEISVSGSRLAGDILSIEDLLISGKPAVLRGVRGEILVHATAIQFDMSELVSQRVKIVRAGKATIVARATARAVQEGLARASSTILKPIVKFQAGQFEVTATIKQGEKLYPAQLRGQFVVEQKQRIRVTVTEAKVSGGDVPDDLIQKELSKINPILDLSKWPLSLQIQRLTLHNDTAELLATSGR